MKESTAFQTKVCRKRHGIHKSWDVSPHPITACAEIIEMAKTPVTFNDVFMGEEFGRMALGGE